MASSQGPLTPGRRSRRSWFDTPPLMSLDPKPAQDENSRPKKPNKRRSIDTVETLTLTHFTSAPRLGFGNAVVGSQKLRTLLIRNPHDYEQEVIIEKFPFKKKFYVDHTRFEVGAGDVFSLEITWTPEDAAGVRELVQFHINGVYRLQCYLFGMAENPKPVRKIRRRKFGPPVSENKDVIQTPALTRIKSDYNPRRSQELRDLQALVENKEFHHNYEYQKDADKKHDFGSRGCAEEKTLQDKTLSSSCKEMVNEECAISQGKSIFESQGETFVRPNPVTPSVFESTSIELGMKHEEASSNWTQQTRTKWRKKMSAGVSDSDKTLLAMSPIPVVSSDEHDNRMRMTMDSSFRPSEMGAGLQGQSDKNTFVVPKAPSHVSEFPQLTFAYSRDFGLKASDQDDSGIEKVEHLTSIECASSNNENRKEVTHNVANGDLSTLGTCDNSVTNAIGKSPSSSMMEFSKRVEWQSPQSAKKLNHSSDLSSASPNTVLDQSLSFIAQVSTPVKGQGQQRTYFVSDDSDIDKSMANESLIIAGQGLVSPTSFMTDMANSRPDRNGEISGTIPSPSAIFNNSIPHNLMMHHLDNIKLSLAHNSPLSKPAKPSLKPKAGTKRRSLTRAYRVAESQKTFQAKKSPVKATSIRRSGTLKRENGIRAEDHLSLNPGLVDSPRRETFIVQKKGKGDKQTMTKRNSPVKRPRSFKTSPLNKYGRRTTLGRKSISPKIMKANSRRFLGCNASESRDKPHMSPLSPKFTSISPSCLPLTPRINADASSRQSLTVTKSRPSDALLNVMNDNRKKLFDKVEAGMQPTVHFEDQESDLEAENQKRVGRFNANDTAESGQECEKLKISQSHEPSPNQFCSPTSRNLPRSPNPNNSRRSTHVVKTPKVVNLESKHQKCLNFDGLGDDVGVSNDSNSELCNGDSYTIPSLDSEIKSRQATPITSVCVMSPQLVDYEVLSNEGNSSGQSVSSDSLDISQCVSVPAISSNGNDGNSQPETPTASTVASSVGVECENRVDVLNDTHQEGVTFTSLKTPSKSLDWSFCERGDTKILPLKEHTIPPAAFTAVNRIEEPVITAVKSVPTAKKVKITENPVQTTTKTRATKPKTTKASIKGVAQPKLILVKKAKNAVPRHPMPYAARNMYYDERWMEKQENGFAHWINFVLTPPAEYVAVTSKPKVDAVALTLGNQQQQGVPPRLAPTKEVLSIRAYAARRRLNRLRRAACQMYQSDQVAAIIRKIEVEVESKRIAARKDRMLHADLGIKQRVLDLLLQYNPLWLRVGLETVFGEVIPLHSNTDVVGLSRYVVTRLLACPDIAGQYAHPSVPHLYTEGYACAVSRHTVKKFLLMIYFMDRAKTQRLVEYDPCLFCKDADIKSSKEILIQFSREVLSGEGDLTRHLAYLGYTVCQTQKPFDEFDYAVTNISSDLKDGLRLSRLMELLGGDNSIMGKLRAPAISRLQKIHNMETFFSAVAKRGLKLGDASGTTARDVVDGHREKTLAMLWHLILHFQANLDVDEGKLKEEISLLRKSLQLRIAMQKIGAAFNEDWIGRRDSGETTTFVNNERMQLIFRWCRLVCLHYGVKIENMTVSFSDGRAFCCLLHHYHPVLLPLSDIRFQTTQQFQEASENVCDGEDPDLSVDWGKQKGGQCHNEDDPAYFEKLLANERANFKVLFEKVSALGGVPLMIRHSQMSNTIPDEKVVSTYVSYLCMRLLDIREEVKAARVIQMAWRRLKLQQTFKQRLWAARIIQKSYRKYLMSKRIKEQQTLEEERSKMVAAAMKLQAAYRGYRERKRLSHQKAAIVVQTFWRMKKAQKVVAEMIMKKEREGWQQKANHAALTIQRFYRGFLVREDLKHVRKCTVILQSLWRMRKAQLIAADIRFENERKLKEEKLRRENNAAGIIQKYYLGFKVRKEHRHMTKCATVIQSLWRMKKARQVVTEMKLLKEREVRENFAAVSIQKCYRGFVVRKEMKQMARSVTVLQSLWRMKTAKRVVLELKLQKEISVRENFSAVRIQKCYRGFKARKELKHKSKCVTVLQSLWRMKKAKKFVSEMKLKKDEEHSAALRIQAFYRGFKVRKELKHLTSCVKTLQSLWRMKKSKRFVSEMRLERQRELKENVAAVRIQKCYRGYRVREEVRRMNESATILQCFWRVCQAKKDLESKLQERSLKQEKAAITIQKQARAWLCQKQLTKMRNAAVSIQMMWREYIARKRAAIAFKQLQMDSAIMIQCWVRSWSCRRAFKRMKQAAICIQRSWRGFVIGQYLEQEEERRQSAATVIQAWYRKCSLRQKYLTLKSRVIFVQRKYRGVLKGKETRAELERTNDAVITVQKAWRQFVVIKEAKALLAVKMEEKRKREERRVQNAAAVVIQSQYRCYKKRQEFGKIRWACVRIQCLWRMQKAKNVLQDLREAKIEKSRQVIFKTVMAFYCFRRFQKTKQAVLAIQKNWRMVLAKKRLDALRKKEKASICIQKNFRAYLARRDFTKLKKAAVTLQMHWRCFLIQKELIRMEKRRNDQERAACILQAFVRGAIQRRNFLRVKNAAAVLQGFYHSNLLARQELENNAATVIQSAVRGYLCFRRYTTRKDAALVIQDWFRRSKMTHLDRMKFLELKSRVVLIQSHFRMCRDRNEFLRKKEAVVKLQAFARRIQAEEQYHLTRNATLILQMYFRAWKSGRVFRQAYTLIRDSCITIQRFYRREKARKQSIELLKVRHSAATKIQACYKCYTIQRNYVALKCAAKVLQKSYRSTQIGREDRRAFVMKREAIITIQKSWRSFIIVKRAKIILEERKEWKRLEMERQKEELQRLEMERQKEELRRLEMERQEELKRLEMERQKEELKRLEMEGQEELKCLEMERQKEELKRLEMERQKEELRRDAAAVVLQKSWRERQRMKESKRIMLVEEERKRMESAAVVIQFAFKQYKLVQHAKLTLEQRRMDRAVAERRREDEQRELERKAVFIIEDAWINHKREREVILERQREEERRREEKLKDKSAQVIQQAYRQFKLIQEGRMLLAEKEEKRSVEEDEIREGERMEAAAICNLLRQREANSSNGEGHLMEVKEIFEETKGIAKQDKYERIEENEHTDDEYTEDETLEGKVRDETGRVENAEMLSREGNLIKRKCGEELDVEREQEKVNKAESRMQKKGGDNGSVDTEVCEDDERIRCGKEIRKIEAAIVIQKYFRGYREKYKFVTMIESIIVIQSHVKAMLVRREFEAYRRSVCLVQRRWREKCSARQFREDFLCRGNAACVIQSWYRTARLARRQRCALKIQALWRGHVVRRDLKCKKLKAARKRLQEANRSGNTDTLGSRTATALAYLLADNDMAYILSALINLEVSTRLSFECCERLVEASAVAVLVKLLSSCNRSVPHMEIIKYTTDILVNLANYERTVDFLLEVPNILPVILNMMQIFREKGAIFYKFCTLLGTLAGDSRRRKILSSCPQLIDRVRSMHALALRKEKRQPKSLAKPSKAVSKELDSPLTAISFVMSSLQIHPK